VTYTGSSFDLATAVFNDLTTNMVALGLQAVYYGDQNKLPLTPVAVVEPGPKTRTLSGSPYRTTLDLTVYVLIYNQMLEDKQTMYEATDALAEAVDAHLNGNTYGGIILYGFVEQLEPGYSQRGGSLLRVNRLTFKASSIQQLTKS
jgi:hypothetical protein